MVSLWLTTGPRTGRVPGPFGPWRVRLSSFGSPSPDGGLGANGAPKNNGKLRYSELRTKTHSRCSMRINFALFIGEAFQPHQNRTVGSKESDFAVWLLIFRVPWTKSSITNCPAS